MIDIEICTIIIKGIKTVKPHRKLDVEAEGLVTDNTVVVKHYEHIADLIRKVSWQCITFNHYIHYYTI